ncbi:hypothetical protein [Vibrio diabolicus]|uniref:hypothetical protein n=1 Tax=Vibrio diabolicus TaxID=50719 RepID=UPI00294052DC|nr:hypothetical protein [Vibrio diabolicus]MDV5034842.1 hypothetical protein [Vibrio diabolicus]
MNSAVGSKWSVSAYKFSRWDKYATRHIEGIKCALLEAIKYGDFKSLYDFPILVGDDGKVLIKFRDNIWPFRDYLQESDFNSLHLANMRFTSIDFIDEDVDSVVTALPSQMRDEIKVFMLYSLFLERKIPTKIETVYNYTQELKKLLMELSDFGMSSFSELTDRKLRQAIDNGFVEITRKKIGILNLFSKMDDLPFKPQSVGSYIKKNFPEVESTSEGEQHCVIPLSVYKTLIDEAEDLIEKNYNHRIEIQDKIRHIQKLQSDATTRYIHEMRIGKRSPSANYEPNTYDSLIEHFKMNDVEFVDDYKEGERWMDVYNELNPNIKSYDIKSHAYKPNTPSYGLDLSFRSFTGLKDFKDFLRDVDAACRFMVQAMSGMRTDELYRMHPEYGLQFTTVQGQLIYLVTTRQSKITKGANTINDVYVTSKLGAKAYQLMNAIHKPLREQFTTDKHRFFGAHQRWLHNKPPQKAADKVARWARGVIKERHGGLTSADLNQLNVSDPARTINTELGTVYHFNVHQLRRSLAFYLIGYELLSYPQLKQQLSHFSLAMTKWYARNAKSYARFYRETEEERLEQQANLMVRIYNKIANKERIGGGKAKLVRENLAQRGVNHYVEGSGDRLLSKAYWKRTLRNKSQHVHAIAPAMYCTNNKCSMRISIDLSDCVDCEFDFIEFTQYAEQVRISAQRDLLIAEELGELSPSFAAKAVVQIKSAEKLMGDLNVDYEEYQPSETVKKVLINVRSII